MSSCPSPLFLQDPNILVPLPPASWIQAFGYPSPQDTGVPAPYSSNTRPLMPASRRLLPAGPPASFTWPRGGLRARRGAGRAAQRGGPIDPGQAGLGEARAVALVSQCPPRPRRLGDAGTALAGRAGSARTPPIESPPPRSSPAPAPRAFFVVGGSQLSGVRPTPTTTRTSESERETPKSGHYL